MRWLALLLALASLAGLASPARADEARVKDLVKQLKHYDAAVRINAAAELRHADTREVRDAALALGNALRDSNAMVRLYAADTLGVLGRQHRQTVISLAGPKLLKLLGDDEWLVVRKVVLTLGQLEISAHAYCDTMRDRHRSEVLKLAVDIAMRDPQRALYYLNAPGAFSVQHEADVQLRLLFAEQYQPLLAVTPPDEMVRELLAQNPRYTRFLLEQIPNTATVLKLVDALDRNDEVQALKLIEQRDFPYFWTALETILRYSHGAVRESVIDRATWDIATFRLNHRHWQISETVSLRFLIASLDDRYGHKVQSSAIEGLRYLAQWQAIEEWLAVLDESHPLFRELQQAHAERYAEMVKKLPPEEVVRQLLARGLRFTEPALQEIDGTSPVIALATAMDHRADARAIAILNDDELPYFSVALPTTLKRAKGKVREAALDRIIREKLTNETAQAYLTASLDDPSPGVRGMTLLALEELDLAGAVRDRLVSQLDDRRPDALAQAIRSLHAMGGPARAGLPKLRDHLRHPDEMVRMAAAETVAQLDTDPQAAVNVLTVLLQSNRIDTRIAAAHALGALGPKAGDAAAKKLADATHDRDDRVADAAFDAYLAVKPGAR